jgi:VanZ family protein
MSPHASPSPARIAALLVPPLVVMGVIFFLSAQTDTGADRAWWDVVLRKLAHMTEYAVLTGLWWRALRGLGLGRPLAAAIAISLLYAASDEFHQTFVEGRTGTPVDVGIDFAGMVIAAVVILRAAPHTRPLTAERGVGERFERAG